MLERAEAKLRVREMRVVSTPPRDLEHLRGRIDADQAAGARGETLEQDSGSRAEVHDDGSVADELGESIDVGERAQEVVAQAIPVRRSPSKERARGVPPPRESRLHRGPIGVRLIRPRGLEGAELARGKVLAVLREGVVRPGLRPPALDEPGLGEEAQVAGNRGLPRSEDGDELVHVERPGGEAAQDSKAGRIREGLERGESLGQRGPPAKSNI